MSEFEYKLQKTGTKRITGSTSTQRENSKQSKNVQMDAE